MEDQEIQQWVNNPQRNQEKQNIQMKVNTQEFELHTQHLNVLMPTEEIRIGEQERAKPGLHSETGRAMGQILAEFKKNAGPKTRQWLVDFNNYII